MKQSNSAGAGRQSGKTSTSRRAATPKSSGTKPPTSVVASSEGRGGPSLSADERRGLIAEAAYLRAENRGFAPGNEVEDWLQAEAEVDQRLLQP